MREEMRRIIFHTLPLGYIYIYYIFAENSILSNKNPYRMKKNFLSGLTIMSLSSLLLLAPSCTDSGISYDDIDMKMKFNADQLKIKFGSTEKIMLADMLKADGNIQVDAENRYYLVEETSTNANFQLATASFNFETNRLEVEHDFGKDAWNMITQYFASNGVTTMPSGGWTVPPFVSDQWISFSDTAPFTLNLNWDDEIQELSAMGIEEATFSLSIELNTSVPIAISQYRNVKVSLPDYIVSVDNTQTFNSTTSTPKTSINLGRFRVKGLQFSPALKTAVLPTRNFGISGEVQLCVTSTFTASSAPTAGLTFTATPEKSTITPTTLTGIFDPEISVPDGTFSISNNVPEFLQNDSVRLLVSNPTLHFRTDLTNIPVTSIVNNIAVSTTQDNVRRTVYLAPNGLQIPGQQTTNLYFYQGDAPYEPNGIQEPYILSQTSNLSSLIERVPDVFEYHLGEGAIQIAPNQTTLEFGKTYTALIDCRLLVPFTFNQGFRIFHTEETEALNIQEEDLTNEDLRVKITAKAFSTIPLELEASVVPLDANGNTVPGVEVTVGKIPAASTEGDSTDLSITLQVTNPNFLQQLDRIRFVITANGTADNAVLRSDQYLQITDAVIRFKGAVINDFN